MESTDAEGPEDAQPQVSTFYINRKYYPSSKQFWGAPTYTAAKGAF